MTAIRFIHEWSNGRCTINHCKFELGMSKDTTTDLRSYMRSVCVHALEIANMGPIGGENKVVEIDYTIYSKRKANAKRILCEQWVFGGTCREEKKCFLVQVLPQTLLFNDVLQI